MKNVIFLLLVVFAYSPAKAYVGTRAEKIQFLGSLISTHLPKGVALVPGSITLRTSYSIVQPLQVALATFVAAINVGDIEDTDLEVVHFVVLDSRQKRRTGMLYLSTYAFDGAFECTEDENTAVIVATTNMMSAPRKTAVCFKWTEPARWLDCRSC